MCTNVSVSVCVLLVLELVSLYSGTEATPFPVARLWGRYKRQSTCNKSQYQCADGSQCIRTYELCDGEKNCTDGSDETEAACGGGRRECNSLSYKCAYGACIDKDKKCNGKADCADGSDERNCPSSRLEGSSSNCGSAKFRCNDGACISRYLKCDGTIDCQDGSDETRELCRNFRCPSSTFQCDYGGCLDGTAKCNGIRDCLDGSDEVGCPGGQTESPETLPVVAGGCRLPDPPAFGTYSSFSHCQSGKHDPGCRNKPGTPVSPGWTLMYSCNLNYSLTLKESAFSVCLAGNWVPKQDCIKLCSPLRSLSVGLHCSLNGEEVSCDQPMKPSTIVRAKCKENYKLVPLPFSSMVCKAGGEWSHSLFSCSPECGFSNEVLAEEMITKGMTTYHGQFPWLTALYMRNKETDKWEQSCGGTLITPHIVLTAAHCVVLSEVPVSRDNITVGLGKYFRDFYTPENNSEIVAVKEIIYPRYYSGLKTNYALDIALLDLVQSVPVTSFIRPVCVDWYNEFPVKPATLGYVSGWGRTENGTASNTVLAANMSYLDNAACITKIKMISYHRFVTHDKFCAEDISSGQVEKGDSGGGMTFIHEHLHYIFGIVSTKVNATVSLFTDLKNVEHSNWLLNTKLNLELNHSGF